MIMPTDLNFKEEGYTLTDNFYEAIFIDRYGNLMDGEFDMGMRGLDHNCILDGSDHETPHYKKWEAVHKQNIVRLVPETKKALIMSFQVLTVYQIELILTHGYEIEDY